MNSKEIKEFLQFEKGLKDVRVLAEYKLKHKATFYRMRLAYTPEMDLEPIDIPAVHYEDADFLFVPWDWQGWLPDHPCDISKIKWRATNTEEEALVLDGLPTLPFWNH